MHLQYHVQILMKSMKRKHNISACIMCLAVLSSLLNLMRRGTSLDAETFSEVGPSVAKNLVCKLNAKEADGFNPELWPLKDGNAEDIP